MNAILAIVLGAIHALCFAPNPLPVISLSPVQLFIQAFLFYIVYKNTDLKKTIAHLFLFSVSSFCVGLYWLYISMHQYGEMPSLLAAGGVLGLSLYLSLYGTLAAYLSHKAKSHSDILSVLAWASSWTISEWLRGTVFTGFPWNNIAYAHVDSIFAGWAPVIGTYGIDFIVCLLSALLALAFINLRRRQKGKALKNLVGACIVVISSSILSMMSWSDDLGAPVNLRLVQTNTPQEIKFDPVRMGQEFDRAIALAQSPNTSSNPIQAIIFPETTIPFFQTQLNPDQLKTLTELPQKTNTDIFMGMALVRAKEGKPAYTNSVMMLTPNTQAADIYYVKAPVYHKQHLVPFGEFIPFGFRWFVNAMNIPLGDFDRGQNPQENFSAAGQFFAPNICYEDVFGEEIRQAVQDHPNGTPGAGILFNISNLAWFGNTWALRQHFNIARMRTLETSRPMVVATNTGITAAIDEQGGISAALPPFKEGVLDVSVQATSGLTPYVRFGNWPILLISLLLLTFVFIKKRR